MFAIQCDYSVGQTVGAAGASGVAGEIYALHLDASGWTVHVYRDIPHGVQTESFALDDLASDHLTLGIFQVPATLGGLVEVSGEQGRPGMIKAFTFRMEASDALVEFRAKGHKGARGVIPGRATDARREAWIPLEELREWVRPVYVPAPPPPPPFVPSFGNLIYTEAPVGPAS